MALANVTSIYSRTIDLGWHIVYFSVVLYPWFSYTPQYKTPVAPTECPRPIGRPGDNLTRELSESPLQRRAPTKETKVNESTVPEGAQVSSRIINNDCGGTPQQQLISDVPTTEHTTPSRAAKRKLFTLHTNSPASPRIIINDWERSLRTGLQPSRIRHLPAIINTTEAGAQRSGTPLPSFLPRGKTPTQAPEIARTIDPFDRALDLALSNRDRRNYRRVTTAPNVTKSNRHKVVRALTHIADKLRPLQEQLQSVIPLQPHRGYYTSPC